jgi:hypothetical protein
MSKIVYGIWCQVSGGVTGTRQAWLKDDGRVQTWERREVAEAHAAHLMGQMNGPYATANFVYRVVEYPFE